MAALNTVEYVFDQRTTSLAAATRHDFAAITLDIAETVGRSFKSVHIEVTCHDNTGGASITSWLLGIKLGAVAFSDTTVTDTISFGGENKEFVFTSGDLSSYFNTNFGSGSSQTCQVGVQFGNAGVINVTAKLIITYEYTKASASTRTKTVRIPIESWSGYLTTTLTQVGSNQIPQLTSTGGLLKEASVTIKSVWIQIETWKAEGVSGTFLVTALDAEAEVFDGQHETVQASSYWYRRIIRRTDSASFWNTSHQLKARSAGANSWKQGNIVMYVTYTYSESPTTTVTNSIALPFRIDSIVPVNTEGYAYADIEFEIQEPGTITMLQSGLAWHWMERYGTAQAYLKAGSQSATATWYVVPFTGGNSTSGLTARIDSGGNQGSAITLARGKNTLRVHCAAGTYDGVPLWYPCGVLYLNYSSGKGTDTAQHAHTIIKQLKATTDNASGVQYANAALDLPSDENWRLFSKGIQTTLMVPNQNSVGSFNIETSSGLFKHLWEELHFTNNTVSVFIDYVDTSQYFDRFLNDSAPNRDSPTAAHDVRYTNTGDGATNPVFYSAKEYYTYHSLTGTLEGDCHNYQPSSNGSGIAIKVFNVANDELIGSTTTTTGGHFTLTMYDTSLTVYAVAYQGDEYHGRSANTGLSETGTTFIDLYMGGDTNAPTVLITDPTTADGAMIVEISDDNQLNDYRITVRVGDSYRFEVYNPTEGFLPPFTPRSSKIGNGSIGSPHIFTIYYSGGWPMGVPIDVYAHGIDFVGTKTEGYII